MLRNQNRFVSALNADPNQSYDMFALYGQALVRKPRDVPARIVWTRVCNSGGLFHGGCLTGFMG